MTVLSKRILVTEFDRNTARILSSCIQAAGFEVILTPDGDTAWELIQARLPILVLMEATLSGLSSLEIVRRVRRSNQIAELPVMILGDPVSAEEMVKWFKLGIDEYISKPFSTQLLVAQMRAIIRRVYGR
jgi:two-component system, OmpR family, phosphate regulon response regulator PhoB